MASGKSEEYSETGHTDPQVIPVLPVCRSHLQGRQISHFLIFKASIIIIFFSLRLLFSLHFQTAHQAG